MTVSSLKKTNNTNSNNNTNASNDNNVSSSQAVLEQQAQQQTTNVDLGSSITDEHHHVNTSRREENDGNVASSNSMPVTTSIINDSSLTNATSLSCSVHPKPKSHYRRPNVIQTNSKHMQRHFTAQEEKFRTSSHSDSSDDDDDDDDADDDDNPFVSDFKPTYNSPNRSKLKTSQRSNSPDLYNSEDEHEKNATKQTKNRSDDLEMRFVRTLKEKKGYTIKPVKEDGACLFRAVADQVFGDEDMHDTVQHCMNYIQQNDDFFRAYITEDFNHYVTRKRRNSCHGNHIEIIALSELYNRPIEVYEYSSEPINVVHGMYRTDNEPIRLSYHSGVHYNSIIDPWRPTAGLGLGLPDLRPGDAQQNIIDNAIQQSEESHIDTTVLNDKLTETDLDATQQEILEEITRQSYFDWVQNKNPQSNESSMVSCSNSRATTSHEHFDFDDESLMEQMLALSTMEYIESLTK